jgi:hypothetical protein
VSRRFKIGDVVLVDWEDSYGCSPKWATIDDDGDAPQLMRCRTVGWITNKDNKSIVVVPHIATNEVLGVKQGCGDMTIPMRAVVAIKRLKV